MQNSARLQQLGIPSLALFAKKPNIYPDKNKTKHFNGEDSESDYDPREDQTSEGEFCAGNKDKVLIPATC